MNNAVPAVEVEDLHKSFGTLEVLKGVSFRAMEGDVISIIGASGSGKSTLLRCINLLENPSAGIIRVGGEALALKKSTSGDLVAKDRGQLERVRSQLGMVFQSFNLWQHKTVMQNVIEAPTQVLKQSKAEATEYAEQVLNEVGVWDKKDKYPAVLSGGQQQRVAIARALAVQPRALLFVEPTSALDPELVGEVLRVIRALADGGRTMILVTHEMRFARNVSSHVIYLHNGAIEEEGAPEQVFTNAQSERCRKFLSQLE